VDQPLPLPLHVSNLAVGGSVSTVPEPELYVLMTTAALIAAFMFCYKNWKGLRFRPGSR
jgi:hypothetical protein